MIEATDNVSDDSYLASLEIRSLYTNIPYKEGIEAVKPKLQISKPCINIITIISFLKLILTLNNFCKNCLCEKNCSLRTKICS